MRRRITCGGLFIGALLLGVAGCQSGPHLPAEPLFASRKPIESKGVFGRPTLLTRSAPPATTEGLLAAGGQTVRAQGQDD